VIFRANPSHADYGAEVRGLELRIVDRPFGERGPPMPEKEKVGHVEWVKNSMPLVETITPWLREALGWGHPRSCPK